MDVVTVTSGRRRSIPLQSFLPPTGLISTPSLTQPAPLGLVRAISSLPLLFRPGRDRLPSRISYQPRQKTLTIDAGLTSSLPSLIPRQIPFYL